MESLNHHLFFCTLTYCDNAMPFVVTSRGKSVRYADIRDFQNMVKRIRQADLFGRPFRYLAVSERSSKGRPHYHVIWSVNKCDDDDYTTCLQLETKLYDAVLSQWKRNKGSDKYPLWQPLCNYKCIYTRNGRKSNFDLHYMSI